MDKHYLKSEQVNLQVSKTEHSVGKVDYHLKNIFNTDGTRNIDDQNNGIKVKFPLTAVAGDIGGPNTAG